MTLSSKVILCGDFKRRMLEWHAENLAYQVCGQIFTKVALEMRTQVIDIREFSGTLGRQVLTSTSSEAEKGMLKRQVFV